MHYIYAYNINIAIMASFDNNEVVDTSLVQKCNTCKATFNTIERVKVIYNIININDY